MSSDSFFWVFSTVAQTIAALVAVAGVVTIFRVEQLTRAMTRFVDMNIDVIENIKEKGGSHRPERVTLDKIRLWYNKRKHKDKDGHDDLSLIGKIVTEWNLREIQFAKIRKAFLSFFVLCCSVLGLCLCLLPFSSCLNNCAVFGSIVLSLILLGSVISIILMVFLFGELLGKSLMAYDKKYTAED